MKDPQEFAETLKADLFEDEVFVFTPKGEVKSLAAGATPLDFAYSIHTDVGHRCVGAKVNGKIVPLHYELAVGRHLRGAHLQEGARPLARLARPRQDHPRAVEDPRLVQARAPRGLRAHRPRDPARATSSAPACRRRSIAGSPLLADVIREMGFKKGEDFYIALGQSKISPKTVVNKLMHRLKEGEAAVEPEPRRPPSCSSAARPPRRPPPPRTTASRSRASTT